MNPDEVHVQLPGHGHQNRGGVDVDAHLGDLPQVDVAGVDVHQRVGPLQVRHQAGGDVLRHGAVLAAGEGAVHVQVTQRNAAGHGADAQRVHCRVQVHRAVQVFRVLLQQTVQLKDHILAFQLIPVGTGDNAEAFVPAAQPIFPNGQFLVHRKRQTYNFLYHT